MSTKCDIWFIFSIHAWLLFPQHQFCSNLTSKNIVTVLYVIRSCKFNQPLMQYSSQKTFDLCKSMSLAITNVKYKYWNMPLVDAHLSMNTWQLVEGKIMNVIWKCTGSLLTLYILLCRRGIWLFSGSWQNEGEGGQGQVQTGESSVSLLAPLSSFLYCFQRESWMHQDQASS